MRRHPERCAEPRVPVWREAGTGGLAFPGLAQAGDRTDVRRDGGTEALYRHLSNEDVTFDALTKPHVVRTVGRVERTGLAFAVSDTTEFKFGGGMARYGLGPLNTSAQGFLAHVTLAVSADGKREPLGVLSVEAWAGSGFKNTRRRQQWKTRSDRTRESLRWGRGMKKAAERVRRAELIHVADRDSDIYEVIAQLLQYGERFVLRAAQNRKLVPIEKRDADRLFEAAQSPAARGDAAISCAPSAASPRSRP